MLTLPNAVRLAVPQDVPELIALMRGLAEFEDHIDDFRVDEQSLLARAFASEAQCQIFVADGNEQISGYAVVLEVPFTYDLRPTMLLKELYVANDCRGMGLGQALMRQVASWAAGRGGGRIKWDVMAGNEHAEAFYQRLGGSPDCKWIPYQMGRQEIERLAMSGQDETGRSADLILESSISRPASD